MLSLLIVVNRVISDTPTCFFLNPSFQSACTGRSYGGSRERPGLRHTLATLVAPAFAGVTAFLPAFFEIAWS